MITRCKAYELPVPLKFTVFKKAQKYLISIYLTSDSRINAIINNNVESICAAASNPDTGRPIII